MKKFDIKKFFNELAKPEKRKKLNPNGNYPDEFGLNTNSIALASTSSLPHSIPKTTGQKISGQGGTKWEGRF